MRHNTDISVDNRPMHSPYFDVPYDIDRVYSSRFSVNEHMESVDSMLRKFLSIIDGAFDASAPFHLDIAPNCTTTDALQLRQLEFRLYLCK